MTVRAASLAGACCLAVPWLGGCATTPVTHAAFTRLPAEQRGDSELQLVVTLRDQPQNLQAEVGATPHAPAVAGGYRGSPQAEQLAAALARDYAMQQVAAWRIEVLGVHCVVFRVADVATRDALLERLRSDRRVESVQPMQRFRTSAQPTGYNDPYFRLQRAVERMRVPEAQELATGRDVRVALVDTGVDLDHPELKGRIVAAANLVDADAAAFLRDRHGTAVAGALAAAGNNGQGIVGVAPAVRLIVLKACWEERPSQPAACNSLTLAEALAQAIERRAQVINLSLTGPPDPLLERLVVRAVDAGIVVVGADAGAAAGGAASFPASLPQVLAIADTDVAADRGRPPSGGRLGAPGREVITTVPGAAYDYVSGVSMSVALASGVIALLLERQSRLAPAAAARLLAATADVAPGARVGDPGSIDAARAVRAATP
ncbi:MAG: S8 family serine peptidase [Steroidobacteraceae bacterium]